MKNKMVLILLLSVFSISLFAQNTVSVTGHFKDADDGDWIYLVSDVKRTKDSALVKNKKFSLTLKLDSGDVFFIRANTRIKGAGLVQIYLQPGKMHVTGSIRDLRYLKFSGDKFATDQSKYNQALNRQPITKTYYKENDDLLKIDRKDTARFYKAQANYFAWRNKMDSLKPVQAQKWLKANPYSDINAFVLYTSYFFNKVAPYEATEQMLEQLTDNARKSIPMAFMKNKFSLAKQLVIGKTAPDFTLYDTTNNAVKLSDFRGKYVMVDFWASWCGYCRIENPSLVQAYNKYKDKGFSVLAVSLDRATDRAKWIKAIQDDGLPFTHVWAPAGKINEARDRYDVNVVPTSFLIDPNGVIIDGYLRGEELMTKLESLFKDK